MSHDHNHAHTGAGTTLILATLLTLGFAAVEAWLARRQTSPRHSYGLGRAEFIAALINSLGLLALVAWLTTSAVERLQAPQTVMREAVSVTAAIGLAINLLVTWLLTRGEKKPQHTRCLVACHGRPARLGGGLAVRPGDRLHWLDADRSAADACHRCADPVF